MGFSFKKRIKIIPGVWINLSKSGISTSIGKKGLSVNLRGKKTKTTVSLPGTGISYNKTINTDQITQFISLQNIFLILIILLIIVIILMLSK